MSRRRATLATVVLSAMVAAGALGAIGGCHREDPDDGTTPKPKELPPLVLRDDGQQELLLTWVDVKGDGHTGTKISDVPIEGRDQVRVVVVGKDEGTHDLFYVANLTVKGGDGTYPVVTMSRSDWDAMIEKRRATLLAKTAPPASAPAEPGATAAPPTQAAPAPTDAKPGAVAFTVVVYGASWCGACHQAMAYLKQRRVPAIEKDIEQDPGAAEEMQQKLARAGLRGGSIPVIDVKGRILIGFEPHQLEAAIASAAGGTAL
jgi:glutaredoxin